MARWRDDLIAGAVLLGIVLTGALLWHTPTFRSFFSWPNGTVWPNFVQAALWVLGAGFIGWFLRGRIRSGLVSWVDERLLKHHGKLAARVEYNHRKLQGELSEMRAALRSLHQKLDGN